MSMSRPVRIELVELVGGNVGIKFDPPVQNIIVDMREGRSGPQDEYALKFAEAAIELSKQLRRHATSGIILPGEV